MIQSLKIGDEGYLVSRRTFKARKLGLVEAIREGVSTIRCDNPIFDDSSNIRIDGQWYSRHAILPYSEVARVGFEIDPEDQ